jgi:hypothetical protein
MNATAAQPGTRPWQPGARRAALAPVTGQGTDQAGPTRSNRPAVPPEGANRWETRPLAAVTPGLAAAAPGELERMRQDLAREWAGRFKDLIADHPDAAGELDGLVQEVQIGTAAASGHAVAAGRDLTITASGGVAAGVIHGNVSAGPTRPGPASS